jgi:S1-C subfamily serine protease
MRRMARIETKVATLALVIVAATVAACGGSDESSSGGSSTPEPAADGQLSQRDIVAQVRPSLVSITTIPPGEKTPPDKGGRHGHASGLVYDARKGLILTSDHFIEGAASIRIVVDEKTEVQGRPVARAQCNDFALIQMRPRPSNLQAIRFGDSSAVSPGDQVTALGYLKPPGAKVATLSNTVGNVSAVDVPGSVHPTLPNLQSLVLHQAPLQLAMSGGALVDDRGRLIGLSTFIDGGAGSKGGQWSAVTSNFVKNQIGLLKPGKGSLYSGWEDQHNCHGAMADLAAKAMGIQHPPGAKGGQHGGAHN